MERMSRSILNLTSVRWCMGASPACASPRPPLSSSSELRNLCLLGNRVSLSKQTATVATGDARAGAVNFLSRAAISPRRFSCVAFYFPGVTFVLPETPVAYLCSGHPSLPCPRSFQWSCIFRRMIENNTFISRVKTSRLMWPHFLLSMRVWIVFFISFLTACATVSNCK